MQKSVAKCNNIQYMKLNVSNNNNDDAAADDDDNADDGDNGDDDGGNDNGTHANYGCISW